MAIQEEINLRILNIINDPIQQYFSRTTKKAKLLPLPRNTSQKSRLRTRSPVTMVMGLHNAEL
jgi:hypothetical protein